MFRFFSALSILFLASILFIHCGLPNSQTFQIRTGVNVSHWLSQSDKRGEERKAYITQSDFENIAQMGFDHVRLPIDEEQFWDENGNQEEDAFLLLHNAIKWAFDENLRVIVDLHIIRSHYFNAESNPLWTNPEEQDKLVELWRQLATELKQYPNDKLAYEILNEAVADNPDDWNKLLNKVIADIRTREQDRIIVVGSNRWQNPENFPDLRIPENDPNLILSFHFYSPYSLTHHQASWSGIAEYKGSVNYPGQVIDTLQYQNLSKSTVSVMRDFANGYFDKSVLLKEIQPAIQFAKEKNLPLYCGEYGIYPTIPQDVALRWYKNVCSIFTENNILYSHWCYFGDFPVIHKDRTPNQKLVQILTAK